jgi:putative ABC transport system ATP-binding protein
MNPTPLLRTSNLCRHYRRGPQVIRAVDDVTLELTAGEFVAIVGASGSGKTTLLNLLAGLDTPTAGDIEIGGTRLATLSRRQKATYRARRVGIIFQSFNLLPHYSALKNVEMAMYFTDHPVRNRRKKATDILESVGLGDRLHHLPDDLSGGEQQRVAIARAIVKRPDILLADEPTGNLDRENAQRVGEILTELHRAGLTVIMVTHNEELAKDHADRLMHMHYGQIAADGDTEGKSA